VTTEEQRAYWRTQYYKHRDDPGYAERRAERQRKRDHAGRIAYNRAWRMRNPDLLAAQARRARQRRQEWWQNIRSSVVCVDCGSTANLDFHHRNPSEKSCNVATAIMYSFGRWLEEVQKCDVLCRSCHKLRHYRMDDV